VPPAKEDEEEEKVGLPDPDSSVEFFLPPPVERPPVEYIDVDEVARQEHLEEVERERLQLVADIAEERRLRQAKADYNRLWNRGFCFTDDLCWPLRERCPCCSRWE
jgi:hypothetical protein